VRVLALVRSDHYRRVLVRPLHPLLHRAPLRRAAVVAPAHADVRAAAVAPAISIRPRPQRELVVLVDSEAVRTRIYTYAYLGYGLFLTAFWPYLRHR
jgi:hypothetical protein